MSILVLTILGLTLIWGKPRFVRDLPDNGGCLTHARTNLINAFFIIIVLLRHIHQRLVPFHGIDTYYNVYFNSPAGQGIVSTFFFFSGYGIMQSILRKQENYVRELMSKRFLRLYFNTAICCILSCLVYGLTYLSPGEAAMSFAQTMVGAGGYWFIIMTLAIYVATWIGFKLCGIRRSTISVLVSASLIYILCVALTPIKPMWWLDTELCFPCGMLLAIYLPHVEGLIRKSRIPIIIIGSIFTGTGWLLMQYNGAGYDILLNNHVLDFLAPKYLPYSVKAYYIFVYPLCTVVWVLGILWLFASVKWEKEPAFMVWLGGPAVFYIFVLHFIPIRLIQYFGTEGEFTTGIVKEAFGWSASHPNLVILSTVLSSVGLAYLMYLLLTHLDALIFEKKSKPLLIKARYPEAGASDAASSGEDSGPSTNK